DVSVQDGTLPNPVPCVLGHEGAGEVVAVGDSVTNVTEGDHVIISWVPPCGACFFCLRGQPNLCLDFVEAQTRPPRFTAGGSPVFAMAQCGTWVEETVLPATAAIKISDEIPYDVASLIGCGVMTGVGAALKTAHVEPGSLTAQVPFNAFELFYFEKKLLGCWYGSADVRTDFDMLLRLWRQGKLDLEGMITRRIDLSEINEAFDAMKKAEVIRSVIEFK